jgi:metal-responsive CopG/Arc/MetJ family transcriptional regulator
MSESDDIVTRITVPITANIAERIDAIVRAQPITTRATIARYALEKGLGAIEKAYPPSKRPLTRANDED